MYRSIKFKAVTLETPHAPGEAGNGDAARTERHTIEGTAVAHRHRLRIDIPVDLRVFNHARSTAGRAGRVAMDPKITNGGGSGTK